MTDVPDRLLDRLRKMHRQVEGAKKIGSINEAEAFAAKLQELLLKHNLNMTDVEAEQIETSEPVNLHPFETQLDYCPYRVLWSEKLASVIAKAHFCRIFIHSGSNRLSLIGRKSNTEICEYLFVTLSRAVQKLSQVEKEMVKIQNRYNRKNNLPTQSLRNFEESFIMAFIGRLEERFRETRENVASTFSTALVRLNNEDRAVMEFIYRKREEGVFSTSRSIAHRARTTNTDAAARGREIANGVNISGNAMREGPSNKRLK